MSTTPQLLSSPTVIALLSRSPPAPLTASSVWRRDLTFEINKLDASVNVRAALHLLNDDFDGCHTLAQLQEGEPYSDHLHYIAHRREPDYWNSKYWAAQLSHRHLAQIYLAGDYDASVSEAKLEAKKFVDAIEVAASSGEGVEELEKRQWDEMTRLTRLLIEKDASEPQ
ncbi:hypothetical protein F5I97DRAFT_1816279 [Phlebopus sp. FC_14]|nr:hypothetical protein F5I97DRAFT_1816279 [Phlebopus sp. FC_14]